MVSIILPTYNRAALVMESIQSVLEQSYADFELIIVDDGSVDHTRDGIIALQDPRIRYFYLPHSGHTGRLKNFAIEKSSGEYLAFIDSDDMWKQNKLERQMKLFSDFPSIGFSITDVTTFKEDKILIDHSYHLQDTIECRNIFTWLKQSRFLVYNPTLVLKKSCLSRCGYFDEAMRSGDYHFNVRLAYHFDAGIIYDTLVWRRVHDSNLSEQTPFENYAEYLATFDYLYKEKLIEKKYLDKTKSVALYKMGRLYADKGNRSEALGHYWSSLKYRWYNPRCYLKILESIFSSGHRK